LKAAPIATKPSATTEGFSFAHGSALVAVMPRRADIEAALRRLAPHIPPHEFGAVVDHALDSGGLRAASPEAAAWLSLVAYVRHTFTDYDERLEQGYDRDSARYFVADEINAVLESWGTKRKLSEED
jgi:hypothetical protein